MLVLTRKTGEEVRIGSGVSVTVLATHKNRVKLGFLGPPEIPIQREELCQRPGVDLLSLAPRRAISS